MKSRIKQLSNAAIRQSLKQRSVEPYLFPEPEIFVKGPARPAAVLIPLLDNGGAWELLFIRRTQVEGDPHSGQVAFPGGRMDARDRDPQATALRETEEEIALAPERIEVLGQLEYMLTISNYKLTPVVGVLPWPVDLVPQPAEVERIFTIPLEWLAEPRHHRIEQRSLPNSKDAHPVIYFNEHDGELLWGVTAHIVLNFLQALDLTQ